MKNFYGQTEIKVSLYDNFISVLKIIKFYEKNFQKNSISEFSLFFKKFKISYSQLTYKRM